MPGRLLALSTLVLLLAGCSGDPGADVPEGAPPATVAGDPPSVQRSAGAFTLVASRNDPTGTQSDYFREGDERVAVPAKSVRVLVNVTVSGGVPGQAWTFCLLRGDDPHDGVCTTGSDRFSFEVGPAEIGNRTLGWVPAFTVATLAPLPVGVGAAQSIAWTADVHR